MSADKREKGKRRRSEATLLANGGARPVAPRSQPHDLRERWHGLALDATGANVGDGVTFVTREAPELPVAPETSAVLADEQMAAEAVSAQGPAADAVGPADRATHDAVGVADGAAPAWHGTVDDVADGAPEEASVTLEQEQRDGAVADELAPDERPTLLGLPLMAGSLSGSSNPDPQSGPETTRRAARPPRATRPVQAYSDAPMGNGAPNHASTPPQSAPSPTPNDADDEPTAPRQAAPQRPEAPASAPAQPTPPVFAPPADAPDAANDASLDSRDAAVAPTPDVEQPAAPAPTLKAAPEGLEPLAALTPLVALGGVAPSVFAEAALAEGADMPDDPDNSNADAGMDADADVVSTDADMAAAASPASAHDDARLQAIDLTQQALGPLWTDQPPAASPAEAEPAPATPLPAATPDGDAVNAPGVALAPDGGQAPQWPGQSAQQAPSPAPPPAPPFNTPVRPPMPMSPMPPAAPGTPLGAQFGAPPPGYQSPYAAQAGGAPLPGQPPGQAQGEPGAPLPTHAPWAVAASWGESSLSGPNTAAGMSYLFWWLSGIFVYFNERQNRFVRFHAMQSILLTGALTIISVLLFTILQLFDDAAAAAHQPAIAHIGVAIVIIGYVLVVMAWFGAMVAAWSGTYLRIPFIGDYAERFAAPPREVYPDSPPY